MKATISYLTIILGLFVLAACGDDDVTSQDLICNKDSYYDYDDDYWYYSRTDRRRCKTKVNDPYYRGDDWNCTDGQVAARVIAPNDGINAGHRGRYRYDDYRYNDRYRDDYRRNDRYNDRYRNDRVTTQDARYRHQGPGGNIYRGGHRSNTYGGFGWEANWNICSSIYGGPNCHLGRNDIHNARDRGRYHVPRDDYFRRSGNFYDGQYRVVCVGRNDRHLYQRGGIWYYDYGRYGTYNNLSTEEALAYTAIGVLIGATLFD